MNQGLRSLSDFFSDFGLESEEGHTFSKTSISRIRDGFGTILKDMNSHDISQFVEAQAAPKTTLVLRHLHDEATMRLKSHLVVNEGARAPRRAKSSKIQNNVLEVHAKGRGSGQVMVPVLLELQPLSRKTSSVLAEAIFRCLRSAVEAMKPQTGQRVIHCLVGDGIPANEAAARKIWREVSNETPPSWSFDYQLISLKCSSRYLRCFEKPQSSGVQTMLGWSSPKLRLDKALV